MFDGIDPTAQVIISINISVFLICLVVIAVRKGISIKHKNNSLMIGKAIGLSNPMKKFLENIDVVVDIIVESVESVSDLTNSESLRQKMSYVNEKINYLRGLTEEKYYKMLVEKNIKQELLSSHPDLQYYIMTLRNVFYGPYGIEDMLRNQLRSMDYADRTELTTKENEHRFENYIDSLFGTLAQKWKEHFYNHYKTNIMDMNGQMRERIITNEELYDSDTESKNASKIKNMLYDVFKKAKEIDKYVNSKRLQMIEKRGEKIKKVISIEYGMEDDYENKTI